MSRTLDSPPHEILRTFLVEKRKAAGLTQAEVAEALGRYQFFVATIESGQCRIDMVELFDLAAAIDFDPHAAIRRLTQQPGFMLGERQASFVSIIKNEYLIERVSARGRSRYCPSYRTTCRVRMRSLNAAGSNV